MTSEEYSVLERLFHVKHAQLRWTGANTKYKYIAYKILKTAGVQTILLTHPTKQLKSKTKQNKIKKPKQNKKRSVFPWGDDHSNAQTNIFSLSFNRPSISSG